MGKLKEYSRSDRSSQSILLPISPIVPCTCPNDIFHLKVWEAAAIDEAGKNIGIVEEQRRTAAEIQKRKDEIRKHAIGSA